MKVFISYTHDSPTHDARVLALSNALREQAGLNCDIDQYHSNQSWPTWMEERLEWADRVIVVCSQTYLNRWNRNEKPGVGLGAKWESFLIKQDLYELTDLNEKFIPVVFCSDDLQYIPKPLRDVTRINIGPHLEGFDTLRNRVLGIPSAAKPPVRTSLLPISCAPDFFSDSSRGDVGARDAIFEFGLRDEPEELFTNLFPVSYPDQIYHMKTTRNVKQFLTKYEALCQTNSVMKPSHNFLILNAKKGAALYSFTKFESPIWNELQRTGEVHPQGVFPTNKWAASNNQGDKSNFIKLLNRALTHLCENNGTRYRISRSNKMECHLFAYDGTKEEGKISTLAIRSNAPRTVYKAIKHKKADGTEEIQHWKHVAFRHRFLRIAETWHIILTPFWAFTSDGQHTPSPWQKISSFNMQKPEKNRAVLGHIAFWASVLCHEDDMLGNERSFSLHRPQTLQVTPSIQDAAWVQVADANDKAEFEEEKGLLL